MTDTTRNLISQSTRAKHTMNYFVFFTESDQGDWEINFKVVKIPDVL